MSNPIRRPPGGPPQYHPSRAGHDGRRRGHPAPSPASCTPYSDRPAISLTAKDPQRRPGDAQAVAQWARRILASAQVAQASAGPVVTGVSLIPPEPGGG
jgi:hypothetical protein